MEHPRAPDGWGPVADPPWDVQVTIVRPPRSELPAGARFARTVVVRATLALVVVAGAVGTALVATARRDSARAPVAVRAGVDRSRGAPATAAAYRYPLGCLGASLSATNSSACWRYGVYVTAVLRRVDGSWRLALEAVSRSCPIVTLPALVRAQVAACVRSDARERAAGH
jgi:hypothetical protein